MKLKNVNLNVIMELICKENLHQQLGVTETLFFIKNKKYKVVEIKEDVIIIKAEHAITVGFKKFKNQVHKFAPNFIGEYFSYNPENKRFVIIEKQKYLANFF